jgi:hypothetical protein
VDVHRTARLLGHRARHEGREDIVAQRGLAHGALEREHLVGERQRIAVQEIDLELRRAGLVDQRVHVQLLRLAEIVHVLDDRIELVDGVYASRTGARIPAGPSAPAAAPVRSRGSAFFLTR